ncbi:hypothetical protein LXL04_034557 [Taraxacum kok-saghyz]
MILTGNLLDYIHDFSFSLTNRILTFCEQEIRWTYPKLPLRPLILIDGIIDEDVDNQFRAQVNFLKPKLLDEVVYTINMFLISIVAAFRGMCILRATLRFFLAHNYQFSFASSFSYNLSSIFLKQINYGILLIRVAGDHHTLLIMVVLPLTWRKRVFWRWGHGKIRHRKSGQSTVCINNVSSNKCFVVFSIFLLHIS